MCKKREIVFVFVAIEKGRLQDDWTSTNNTHSGNLKNVWKTLIARSQQAYDNNPVMRGLQAELSNNVVGTGMVPVSNVTDSNGKPAVGINKALNEGWKRFNDSLTQLEINRFMSCRM